MGKRLCSLFKVILKELSYTCVSLLERPALGSAIKLRRLELGCVIRVLIACALTRLFSEDHEVSLLPTIKVYLVIAELASYHLGEEFVTRPPQCYKPATKSDN